MRKSEATSSSVRNSVVVKVVDKKNKYLTSSVRASVVDNKADNYDLAIKEGSTLQFEPANIQIQDGFYRENQSQSSVLY